MNTWVTMDADAPHLPPLFGRYKDKEAAVDPKGTTDQPPAAAAPPESPAPAKAGRTAWDKSTITLPDHSTVEAWRCPKCGHTAYSKPAGDCTVCS